jgi:poly(beta-D-mannuronate) lyase
MLAKIDDAFRLSMGSPAIDAALGSYPDVMDNIDDQPRTKPDVGADEMAPA